MSNESNHGLLFPARPSPGRNVLWVASIALIYFIAAQFSLLLEFQPEGIAALWPPSGVFLSAILLTRRNLRPWLVGTLFLTDFMAERLAGTPFLVSALYSLSLAGDAALSAWLLHRFVGEPITFRRVRDVAGWLALSVLLSNGLTSLVAAAASELLPGTRSFWSAWQWSAIPDGVGNLLVTPFILTWAVWARTRQRVWSREKAFEAAALFIPLALLNFALFSHLSEHKLFALFLPYVTLPFLLWAALRFGVRGVATAMIILAAIAIPFAVTGSIPSFSYAPGVLDDVIVMQLFIAITAVPSLFLAAVVAERHQAEAARLAGAQRHAVTLKSIGDAVIATDTRGMVELVNPVAETLTGWTNEKACGQPLKEVFCIINEETRQAVESPVERVLREGMVVGLANHTVLVAKDGAERPIADAAAPIRDEQNQVLGVVLVFRDQSQERAAAAALRESEDKFKYFFEHSNVGKSITRPSGKVQVNQAFCDLVGYSPAELQHASWQAITHPEDLEPTQRMLDGLLGGKQDSTRFTKRFLHKNGSVVWADVSTALRRDLAGQPLYFMTAVIDITERQQAEAALRESEMQLQLAIEAARMGTWDWNIRTGRVVWSPGHEALWGYAPGSFPGTCEGYESRLHPDDVEGARRAGQKALDEHSNYEHEYRVRWPDGTVRWIASRGQAFYGLDDKPARMIGVAMDITEHKRAEALKETLLSLTTRLSVASTAANVARSVFAVADRLWQWECGVLDVCSPDGGETETVLCVDVVEGVRREILPPGTRNKCSPRERRILMHGAELMLRTPEEMKASDSMMFGDTARLSASLMCVPIRQRGEPVGVLSIQSYRRNAFTPADLETLQGLADYCGGALERIRAEAQLREQAALLDAATDAIYVRTLDHTVTYWNASAERLYGWPRAEALGRKITDLGDADHAAFEAAHATLLAQGSWSGELRKTSMSGKEMVVFCRWTLLRDEQGRPREVLAINTDITGQKQMEANFLRAQRMEGIGALAGGIAHDLNNILTPILMVGPLLRETVSDPESVQMINTVEACAQRGADIIKQLLTFARGKPGVRAPLPVRHLLNEMHKLIRETFPRNIQSRVNVPRDLWLILGDATQIHQALMNLCVNARDALPEGGTLTLAAENVTLDKSAAALAPEAKAGEYVRVSVTDTGAGIPPEIVDRIFDPFFTTKEIGKGTGLGLATVLGIVRGHGGFVRVSSREGQGTTFELYLPASPEATAAGTPAAEARPPRGQGELILVVDDEAAVREITQQTLEVYGYRVLTAGEGAEALTLFGQHRGEVRAVLMDMMMPGMDGPKLAQALRQLDAQLPLLGMTGLLERTGVKGLDTLKLSALLTKPFAAKNLIAAMSQALAKSV
jgi:PAS domain S-box-containing protein